MANPSSDNHNNCTELSLARVVAAEAATEVDASCIEAERAASDASISALHSFQDIIEHEYALVESIPDEERATLMPIIRFVRNTLQDPCTSLYDLPQGYAMDALYTTERSRGVYSQDVNEVEGSHFKDMEMMLHRYAFNVTEEMWHRNVDRMVDIHKECAPLQRVVSTAEAFGQHWSFQGSQHQKEVQDITSMCPTFGTTYPFSNSIDALQGDYVVQPQAHQGFSLGSKGQQDPSSLASPGDHESELSSILSGMDMGGFHLEELRRSLRPSSKATDSDVDGIDSLDVSNYGNNGYGDGDDDDDDDDDDADVDDGGNVDENDESFLAYPHYDNGLRTSDVAWHSYWGNDLRYDPVSSSTDSLLQFPKLHCRRRNVVKRVVGWVKKRASQSFASRVRHKRRCNLPCCTDCEAGIKRRKVVTGSASKRCAKFSAITKAPAPSTATISEKRDYAFRQARSKKDGERDISAIYESLDGREASQVTRDWANAPLATALSILLLDSGCRGMTMYEALHILGQKGYTERLGSDSQQALAAHVKTTLKKCPEFKELKNHRFVLRDRHREFDSGKQSINRHTAFQKPHFAKSPKREKELSMSQEGCSQGLTKNLGTSSSSKSVSKKPVEWQRLLPQCRKTDGKHWRCMRNAKLGFLYCDRHQQRGCRNPNHPPHEKSRHPYASGEEFNAAKKEEMSETVVDSCSGQSVEQDTEEAEAEPTRCCRTDGRNWQCSNQAEDGSLYCEHHQGRCKKGMIKGHYPDPTSILGGAEKLPKAGSIKQTNCSPIASRFAMQLRPRHNISVITTCLTDV